MKDLFAIEKKDLMKTITSICQSFDGIEFWSANTIMYELGKTRFYDYSEVLFNAMKKCIENGFSYDDHFFATIIDVYISKYGLYMILQNIHNINERFKDSIEEIEWYFKKNSPLTNSLKQHLSTIQNDETEGNNSTQMTQKRDSIIVDSNKLVDTVKKFRISINGVDCWSVSKLMNEIGSINIFQVRGWLKIAAIKCREDNTTYDKHFKPFLFDVFIDQYGLCLLLISICKNVEVIGNLYTLGVKRYPNDYLPEIKIKPNDFFLINGEKVVLINGIKGKRHQFEGAVFTVRIHNFSHGVALLEEGDKCYSRFEVKVTPYQHCFR